jgi:hypothetical protein
MLGHAMARRKPYKPQLPPDVVLVRVDDPFRYSDTAPKVVALASTRDDPLLRLWAHKAIDDTQLAAGRLWQKYREQSEVGGLKAIDTTKEPVDGGGGYPEPITDAQKRAVVRLNEARVHLGRYGADLLESVLWERHSLVRAAAARKFVSRNGLSYLGRRFRECLEALAKLWGLAS